MPSASDSNPRTHTQKRWDRILPRLAAIAAFLTTTAIGLLMVFWLLFPYHFLTWHDLHVSGPQEAGTYMQYEVHVCKYTPKTATVSRNIFGVKGTSGGYVVPAASSVAPEGCHVSHLTLFLPPTIVPGTYQLRDSISFNANPIRTVTYLEVSNDFQITKYTGTPSTPVVTATGVPSSNAATLSLVKS